MSRFSVTAELADASDEEFVLDEDCSIGWDDGMETYFFRSGLTNEITDEPIVWHGKELREYEDLESLLEALRDSVEISEEDMQRILPKLSQQ